MQAWQHSQFLHGEQGGLVCCAKLVQQAPNLDAKYFAATQVMDEARHVEIYSRLLREKFALAYPITPPLKALLDDVVRDSRWDMTYLGIQVLIEGLALAAFRLYRDDAKNPLIGAISAYVMQDEARHVEIYSRLLREKFALAYPITPPLKALLDDVVRDSRWDMTYLGIQVLIEGLALAAFRLYRDDAKNPLIGAISAYVMQDEARHVAFGQIVLRDYYPHLTEVERREREEFVIEGCYRLRDRFLCGEVWETVGLPAAECTSFAEQSQTMNGFRLRLFSRIVPLIREIGLCGPKVRQAFAKMGVLQLANVDLSSLILQDGLAAARFDKGSSEANAEP